MPSVKNLTDEKEKVTITKKDVGTIDAANNAVATNPNVPVTPSYGSTPSPLTEAKENQKVSNELVKSSQGMNLPSFLQKTTLPEVEDTNTGYVGFASAVSKNWSVQQANGLSEGEPFINYRGQYVRCEYGLQFFLLMGDSFQSIMVGKEGKFLYVTRDMNATLEDIRDTEINLGGKVTKLYQAIGPSKLERHYVMLMLCLVGDNVLPIKGDFRGTKSGGMESAIRATEEASNPQWINLNQATKATAAFPQPFGRVFHTIDTTRHVSKSGPGRGNSYYRANCNSRPATIAEMQKLVTSLSNPDFQNELQAAKESYDNRIAFLEKIMNEGPQE